MNNKLYIQTDPETNRVMFTHYMPFDPQEGMHKTEEELKRTGFLVDPPPQPEHQEGKYAIACYTAERGYYYEYEVIPPMPKDPQELALERNKALSDRVDELENVLQEMILNSYNK